MGHASPLALSAADVSVQSMHCPPDEVEENVHDIEEHDIVLGLLAFSFSLLLHLFISSLCRIVPPQVACTYMGEQKVQNNVFLSAIENIWKLLEITFPCAYR